jgi:hypothetical protein
MPIRIDADAAEAVLERAVARAQSAKRLPPSWISATESIGAAASKTYTAALGTALLARATDPAADPMSIKATPNRRSAYSARTLCHGVLVPASRRHGFDLGATGREPLNNQPFFRYERMDEMDRVRDTAGLKKLLASLRKVSRMSESDAADALAAYVRVRLQVAAAKQSVSLRGVGVGVRQTMVAAEEFITEDTEGGKRGQAFVAAVLDLVFDDVQTGRVNDPSRRFPGDVRVLEAAQVVLAAEVKQKTVTVDEVVAFAGTVAAGGVANAVMVALDPSQPELHRETLLLVCEQRHGVLMSVIESVDELLGQALMWSGGRIDEALAGFPQHFADRLEEIEVRPKTIERWKTLLSEAGD